MQHYGKCRSEVLYKFITALDERNAYANDKCQQSTLAAQTWIQRASILTAWERQISHRKHANGYSTSCEVVNECGPIEGIGLYDHGHQFLVSLGREISGTDNALFVRI
jgi:hypothetical protein